MSSSTSAPRTTWRNFRNSFNEGVVTAYERELTITHIEPLLCTEEEIRERTEYLPAGFDPEHVLAVEDRTPAFYCYEIPHRIKRYLERCFPDLHQMLLRVFWKGGATKRNLRMLLRRFLGEKRQKVVTGRYHAKHNPAVLAAFELPADDA
jgi:hypothetical protein